MADTTSERAGARAAMTAPATALDETLLGAVHHGLLTVAADTPAQAVPVRSASPHDGSLHEESLHSWSLHSWSLQEDERPQLAIRDRRVI